MYITILIYLEQFQIIVVNMSFTKKVKAVICKNFN